jgi:glycosyltransferase involved in cell wall biosynthesis
LLPKVGMTLAPLLLALASLGLLRRLIREGFDFDLIDAHYFYPDGVAAALLARWLGKPLLITARGSDVNLIAQHALPRRMIRWAANRADAVIGVSAALVEVLGALGVETRKLHVVRNGVDLERFKPWPGDETRLALQVTGGPVLLSVGNLVVNKGHDLVIDAMVLLKRSHPDIRLIIVGSGAEQARLMAHVRAQGVAQHVTFAGAVPNEELAGWYSVADALVLASSREGWPNVLLEAMACGTPVVATRVGGIPEVVTHPHAGVIAEQRTAAGIAQALANLLSRPVTRAQVRSHAETFGWESTSQKQATLFRCTLKAREEFIHA